MRTLSFLCIALSLVSPFIGLAQTPKEEIIDLGAGVKIELVLIPAGKFVMGSPTTEQGRSTNEIQHEVILSKPFLIGKYEVTQSQWEAIMGNNPSSGDKGPMLPVTDVSWNDCQKFLKKLNEKTKSEFRLPSEAEWEYACRAGTTTAFSFGNELKPTDANHAASNIYTPVKVGTYKPNAFGLYDMHGNVNEWCNDWFKAYPTNTVTDPTGPANGEYRIVRGGTCVLNSFQLTVFQSQPRSCIGWKQRTGLPHRQVKLRKHPWYLSNASLSIIFSFISLSICPNLNLD